MVRAEAPGAAVLHLVDGVPLLRPEEQVFAAMLDGWRAQGTCTRDITLAFFWRRLRTTGLAAATAGARCLRWVACRRCCWPVRAQQ